MWWNGPVWGSWGMPWWMLLFPVLFLLCMVFMAYNCMRGRFPFPCCSDRQFGEADRALIAEVRSLRQELDELRKEIKK